MEELKQLQEIGTNSNLDMEKAFNDLQELFSKNYMNEIALATSREEEKTKNAPTREITLLRAIKGFSSQTQQKSIDNAINTINFVRTAQNITSAINGNNLPISMRSSDNEENNQGVSISNIFMLMSLMKKL